MRIGILTTSKITDKESAADHLLKEVGEKMGHTVDIIYALDCCIRACVDTPKIFLKDEDISNKYDAIIPRLDIPHTEYGLTILRQFQAMDVYTSDTAFGIENARDKLRCFQYMMRAGVPLPKTAFAFSKNSFDTVIDTLGGAPLIIKLVEGTDGYGVFLAEEERDVTNFLATFKTLDTKIIAQEFIAESAGTDIRCMVVGEEIFCFSRTNKSGDFRANVALGGQVEVIDLTPEEKEIALLATQAIGLNVAGVDLIRSDRGLLVIEVNPALNFAPSKILEDTPEDQIALEYEFAEALIRFAENGRKAYIEEREGVWLDPETDDVSEALKAS